MTTDRVVLLDANVLLALANEHHVHHLAAHEWFGAVPAWATTPMTEAAFVRLQSNPVVTGQDIGCAGSLAALASMRRHPGHVFVADDASLAAPLIDTSGLIGHKQVTDFHLLNLCAVSNCILAAFDAKISGALAQANRHLLQVVPV